MATWQLPLWSTSVPHPSYPPFGLDGSLPDTLQNAFEGRLALAIQLAIQAGEVTLSYFRQANYRVERKRDRSPVTDADVASETTIRDGVANAFPSDTVSGEELGTRMGTSDYEWIVDPIDGTKSFISGVPLYSTLIGVTRRGAACIGVIAIPALREIVVAGRGLGAWYLHGRGTLQRTTVSQQSELADSLFVTSQIDNFDARNARTAYHRLETSTSIARTWGDGYGYLLVATGRAEVMVDPIVHPWDAAAILPIIDEAGGKCTDWTGAPSHTTGNLVATNGRLHDPVLSILNEETES